MTSYASIIKRLAIGILVIWILLAFSTFFMENFLTTINLEKILQPPSWKNWLGYDHLGRSLMAGIWSGAWVSFIVAIVVVSISMVVGTAIGITAAWRGGWFDLGVGLVIDSMLAFPGILLAIALAGLLGPGLDNVILAMTIPGWVGFARVARAQAITLKERGYIKSAVALGIKGPSILLKHFLPLIAPIIIVQATFDIAAVILAEASLAFLGIGVQPPMVSWGGLIRDGVRYMLVAPHAVIIPGVILFFVVFSIQTLGDSLRDRLDVKLK